MAPRAIKFPCGQCGKPVKNSDATVFCEVCLFWLHCKCVSICSSDYRKLQHSEGGWCCPTCEHSALPFADCSSLSLGDDKEISVTTPSTLDSTISSAAASRLSGHQFIYYANCRSLLPKMDELHYLVTSSSPPTIIALTETWLNSTIKASEVQLPSYHLYRRDRSRQGGGVAIYIHESLQVKAWNYHPNAELLSVIVPSSMGLLLLAVMYRPPGLDSDLSEFESVLHSLRLPMLLKLLLLGTSMLICPYLIQLLPWICWP